MNYTLRWWLSWILGAVAVVAGVLAGASQTPYHPAWLTGDVAATAGIVAAICAGLLTRLPDTGRTPGTREAAYLSATVGMLPEDLQKKFPSIQPPPP